MTVLLPFDSLELKYTLHLLLRYLLGLDYELEIAPEEQRSVEITLLGGKRLSIAVDPWLANPKYDKSQIPASVKWFKKNNNAFIPEQDLPILYGEANLAVSPDRIDLNADLLSTTFFMLSRWEEHVVKERDQYGRFPANAALSVKSGFYQRPIVDEYAEMLWNMLQYLGIQQERKKWEFKLFPTHDIDNPRKWRGLHTLFRTLGGDLLKRKSPSMARNSWRSFWKTRQGTEKDPFDTFDFLMDCSERYGLQSHFFFLCGGKTPFDKEALPPSHPIVQRIFEKINRRGHVIGLHSSYDAYTDEQLFKTELELLQKHAPQEIKCGRQHYLRFEVPTTWQLWAKEGLEWESSMVYPEEAGFRCGICREFPVFDIHQRKMLPLFERPLILMEGSWMRYNPKSPDRFLEDAKNLMEVVKRYKGTFVLLWHNSTLGFHFESENRKLYERILSFVAESES